MAGILNKLRNLDAYPKINEDFYSRTLSGGVITLVSSVVMFLLFFSELRLYLHSVTETKLVVDTSRGETLRINFDMTFPALACSILSVDAMDISGELHLDVKHDVIKRRLDSHGNIIESRQDGIGAAKIEKPLQKHGGRLEHNETYCGSCYGAEAEEHDCCNSCEDVREAYRKKGWGVTNPDLIDQCKREGFLQRVKDEEGEGCNIYGFLEVNKVAGNFHFAPGKSFHQAGVHVHDLLAFQKDSFNISHKINRLTFGDYFPGVVNPLDKVQWSQDTPNAMYQYFIKVVPTVYTDISGHTIQSNQFSVTEHVKSSEAGQLQSLPGVFFFYDLSPIKPPLSIHAVQIATEEPGSILSRTHYILVVGCGFSSLTMYDAKEKLCFFSFDIHRDLNLAGVKDGGNRAQYWRQNLNSPNIGRTSSSVAYEVETSSASCHSCTVVLYDMRAMVTPRTFNASVGSTDRSPTKSCCDGVKTVLEYNPNCLCIALESSRDMGFELINRKALAMPSICNIFINPHCDVASSPTASISTPGTTTISPSEPPTNLSPPVVMAPSPPTVTTSSPPAVNTPLPPTFTTPSPSVNPTPPAVITSPARTASPPTITHSSQSSQAMTALSPAIIAPSPSKSGATNLSISKLFLRIVTISTFAYVVSFNLI
ncbi:unnamed protein product [Brassica napus]|uniref:(rape) hypothetical protein n=1 Tax=Brassica napus TaxID=3708 RepID=A0A817A3C1_BRANA|nr:unnamed protein product [Brassica napus]